MVIDMPSLALRTLLAMREEHRADIVKWEAEALQKRASFELMRAEMEADVASDFAFAADLRTEADCLTVAIEALGGK